VRKPLPALIAISVSTFALGVALAGPIGAAPAAPPGPLRVGTTLPAPSFWVGGDTPDKITSGFEYDLAKAIATKLGYPGVQVVNVPFESLLSGKAKGIDLGMAQALIPAKRGKVQFSTPYQDFDLGVLVNKGTAVPDLATAKRIRWGTWTGSPEAAAFLGRTVKPTVAPQSYPDLATAVKALEDKQIDAVLDYTVAAQKQAGVSRGLREVVGQFASGQKVGAVFPAGSKLPRKVNQAIKALKADGTLAALSVKYFGTDPAKTPFITVPAAH